MISSNESPLSIIKFFDILPKVREDLQERSVIGATGSLITTILLIFLIYHEASLYHTGSIESVIVVDHAMTEKLKIHLNMTFPRLPCAKLAVDVIDATGSHDHKTTHNIQKNRLDYSGNIISAHRQRGLGKSDMSPFIPIGYCGSCYGAEERPNQCCNSCSEVKRLFMKLGKSMEAAAETEQCVREDPESKKDQEAGCQIIGYLMVPKVKGEFHVAAGSSEAESHNDHSHHIHRFTHADLAVFNSSHIINHLSFGEPFPGMVNPLDGSSKTHFGIEKSLYVLEVVPAVFKKLDGSVITSNQFATTEHHRTIPPSSIAYVLPGVFFKYDLSPMKIQYTEKETIEGVKGGIVNFIVRMCALIGGIYLVMGLLLTSIQMILELILPAKIYSELSSVAAPLGLTTSRV